MARKLRQVVDLYTTGQVVPLSDGSTLWVQVLNPFEQDTARNEAQIAKARLALALREHGGDEQAKVRDFFTEAGEDTARSRLVDAKIALATPRIVEGIYNDPEWSEKLSIIDRGEDDTAKPLEPAETALLESLLSSFSTELGNRLTSEREFLTVKYEGCDADELWNEYLDWYIERRASEVMFAEYRANQFYFGTRWCEAVDHGEGTYTHENCNGHMDRVFSSKEEVRTTPSELLDVIGTGFDALEMTVRDAKNSDRQGSSSGSSPLPGEVEASTASTRIETPSTPLGTSASPSPTPFPSSGSPS